MDVIVGTFTGIVIGFIVGWLACNKYGAKAKLLASQIKTDAGALGK